jgi:IMP dehydrogenase
MKKYLEKALSFDDVLLVPQHSDISSRHNVSLDMVFGKKNKLGLSLPLIAAPMDTVCGPEMAVTLAKQGAVGSIHRYMSQKEQLQIAQQLEIDGNLFAFFAIGATGNYIEHAERLRELGVCGFIVDTANGHNENAIKAVKNLSHLGAHIMAGNVSTWDGFKRLSDAGADSIRVGIGGGSACTTRIVTGHGIPTLASILDIAERWQEGDAGIVADGGIRNSGDAVKAFAAGAHAVMLGSVLAGHDESPGETHYDSNGNPISKEFRGMASADAQRSRGHISVVEGVSTTIPYKGSVINTLDTFKNGIKSGISYTGIDKLSDLSVESMYVEVSSLAKGESVPHAIK